MDQSEHFLNRSDYPSGKPDIAIRPAPSELRPTPPSRMLEKLKYCYGSVGAQNSQDTIFAISFMCSQSQKSSVHNRKLGTRSFARSKVNNFTTASSFC